MVSAEREEVILMSNQKKIQMLIIACIIFLTYNICIWAIPFRKTASSWLVYGFSIISFMVFAVTTYLSVIKPLRVKEKFYGLPVFQWGYRLLGFEIIFCVLMYAIGNFIIIPVWLTLVLVSIITAIGLVGTLMLNISKETIEEHETKLEKKISWHQNFEFEIENVYERLTEPYLKDMMGTVFELVRCSDPVSSDGIKNYEDKLSFELKELKTYIMNNVEKTQIANKINVLKVLMNERNRKNAILKK